MIPWLINDKEKRRNKDDGFSDKLCRQDISVDFHFVMCSGYMLWNYCFRNNSIQVVDKISLKDTRRLLFKYCAKGGVEWEKLLLYSME